MQITIRLLGSYRRYLPAGHDDQAGYVCQFPAGSQVGDVLAQLTLPADDAYTVLVNGSHAHRDQVLQEGDVLAIFPAVGGG
jgi:sulfur carrier protein ThiS